jgi:hypothetical protein
VFELGFSSPCVIDPRCVLHCDIFLPLFSKQDRHLGILYSATWCVALMSQYLILCCISFISACVYISCRRSSSCWAVFMFVMYVVGYVVLCVSLTVTHLRPLKIGCCAKFVVAGIGDDLGVRCIMHLIVGILVFGW